LRERRDRQQGNGYCNAGIGQVELVIPEIEGVIGLLIGFGQGLYLLFFLRLILCQRLVNADLLLVQRLLCRGCGNSL
jgi:hypothetical protein